MKILKKIELVDKLIISVSILILFLGNKNIYLDIFSVLFVINQSRYTYSKKIRRVVQFIFGIVIVFSIYYSGYFLLIMSMVVLLTYSNRVFNYFKRIESLSIRNSPVNKLSKFVSFRFKWNYINLRKDWLNSSNLVLNIIVLQFYLYRINLDFTLYFILPIFFNILLLYKIVNLSSLTYFNLNRNLNKKLFRLSRFVSLQDSWIIVRATSISMIILFLLNRLMIIDAISMIIIGLFLLIVLRFITFVVLIWKSNFYSKKDLLFK